MSGPTLYLMRHSIAVPADFQTTDESRWLTVRGRALAEVAGRALRRELDTRGLIVDSIVSSPLVRTVQTAELVAKCLGYEGEIGTLQALRSEARAQRGVESVEGLGLATVVAVTHEPIVSTMSALLTGTTPSGFGIGYRPSEICGFQDGRECWRHRP